MPDFHRGSVCLAENLHQAPVSATPVCPKSSESILSVVIPDMRILLVCVLVALCAVPARSEEGEGVCKKLKKAVREFVDSMRTLWGEMKDEIKARTTDMRDWSKEMFDSFKTKMNEWVNEMKASDSEKEEMRDYIERLEMPNEE